jgi:hypothetical protein
MRITQILKLVLLTGLISGCWTAHYTTEKDSFTEKEIEKAEKATPELVKLELEANKGNSDAQLKLFKEMRAAYPEEALRWLCKSADQGNHNARHILGSIYEHDEHIWVDRYFVRQDYQLAYMWYSLGGQMDGEMLNSFADRHLNSEELSEAKNLLREWTPGQCERDLDLVSHTE